ncbi:MAG: NAD(P)/FAD-dependent oxidoreductase [Acetobacteraceae bacterium]|nr:NAD(P)/FAD-dependent oxidoreductase [Acetobacteraceae bacterium]
MTGPRPKIVIVGAGFGGLAAARHLAAAPVDITVFDRTNHHLFQPLLYQVATAALAPTDIASPIRSLLSKYPNVEVQLAEIVGVDRVARTVAPRHGAPIPFDYLVLATGSVASWFGHDDWQHHSFGLKTLVQATRIRQNLLAAFERAERATDPADIARLLTFVVVGGGPSGVELAGSIRELADATLRRDFRRIDPPQARILLFEAGPALLAGFPDRLSRYAKARLERMGVEIRTGAAVDSVDASGVVVAGQPIPSANVFWCAGVAATPAATWLGVHPAAHGTVPVQPDCSIPGAPDIFAIGDLSAFPGPGGKPLPGVAPVAEQQGRYVAGVIAARVAGRPPPPPFRYRDRGSLAVIGRAAAVADLPHAKLTGFLAWLMWSGVHLFLLNGLRNRILVYVQWFWAWLTYSRGARVIEGDPFQDTGP